MKATRTIAVAALIVGSSVAMHVARAQQPGIKRTDLQRHDLGVRGREVVQVRVDFGPGVAFGRHSHPGEEIVYVLEGSLEYDVDGKPPHGGTSITSRRSEVARVTRNTATISRSSSGRSRHRSGISTSSRRAGATADGAEVDRGRKKGAQPEARGLRARPYATSPATTNH
jgi:hypothetical protein